MTKHTGISNRQSPREEAGDRRHPPGPWAGPLPDDAPGRAGDDAGLEEAEAHVLGGASGQEPDEPDEPPGDQDGPGDAGEDDETLDDDDDDEFDDDEDGDAAEDDDEEQGEGER
jgi:hypothetical protein